MKILFVFTGGTIGSTQSGNVIFADGSKSYKIIDAYKKRYGIDFEYHVAEPYSELSENNTGWHIRKLVTCIKENANKGYDGIIVTHGSDTLQYSSAAIGYCLGVNSLPVCIVAANSPIENENSNALDNLRSAVCFIERKAGKGAFVVYRNSNSTAVHIHRATRIIASKAYSDEVFSVRDMIYGSFDSDFDFCKNLNYFEKDDEAAPLDVMLLNEASREIMMMNVYPAMIYPQISESVKYVILNTYHSGTLNTKSQIFFDFVNEASSKNVKIYVTGISDGPQYSSAEAFETLGLLPLKNISPISAYVKLWLISSMGNDPDTLMQSSLCGDVVM